MKIIKQPVYTEGVNAEVKSLNSALKQFHSHTPFANGFDWEYQYLWAKLTDEDCLAFCLRHPEYANRFKEA